MAYKIKGNLEVAKDISFRQASTSVQTLTYASEVTVDWDDGQMATITLTGNVKLMNPSHLKAGSTYQIFIKQGGTGGYTLELDTAFKNTLPALSITVGSTDVLTLTTSNGTDIFCTLFSQDYVINQPRTRLAITGTIAATTTLNVTASGTNYTKTGDNGYLLSSKSLFDESTYVRVYLNSVLLENDIDLTWLSSTTFNFKTIILENTDIVIILS